MKKTFAFLVFTILTFSIVHLYGSGGRSSTQIADLFVCERDVFMAELQAKVNVSRSALYVVSHCKCQSVNPEIKNEVEIRQVKTVIGDNGKIVSKNVEADCLPPKDKVYSCICIGRTSH